LNLPFASDGEVNMPFPVPGRIAEFLRRATVQIRASGVDAQGSGSGLVLTAGQIITNAHVAMGSDMTIELWDGTSHKARVIRKDAHHDLALLSADTVDAPPAALSGNEPKAGAAVIAVGNPLGFVGAVSSGFVQAVGVIRGLGWRRWVQADVRLAPGNSGGPLADVLGQIVGINTMIAGGLALAIPAATLQRFLSAKAARTLGVTIRLVTLRSPRQAPRPALLILELTPGGAAERASLLPGDILLEAAGQDLHSPDDLSAALTTGDLVSFAFHRAGDSKVRRVTVELASNRQASAA
jgi:serine protease Do